MQVIFQMELQHSLAGVFQHDRRLDRNEFTPLGDRRLRNTGGCGNGGCIAKMGNGVMSFHGDSKEYLTQNVKHTLEHWA